MFDRCEYQRSNGPKLSHTRGCLMVFYLGNRYDAAILGRTVVGVKCDKCDCVYYFELARVGTGIGEAPYGIGNAEAASAAQRRSESDLQERLATEAELVPCPKCHWINDELVQGYRRSRFRGLTKATVLFCIVGTASALVCSWFINLGDRK